MILVAIVVVSDRMQVSAASGLGSMVGKMAEQCRNILVLVYYQRI